MALNIRLPNRRPRDMLELRELCNKHNMLDLYLLRLFFRFPKFFVEPELCIVQKAHAVSLIGRALE